jgi:hypothetical protein
MPTRMSFRQEGPTRADLGGRIFLCRGIQKIKWISYVRRRRVHRAPTVAATVPEAGVTDDDAAARPGSRHDPKAIIGNNRILPPSVRLGSRALQAYLDMAHPEYDPFKHTAGGSVQRLQ